MSRCVSVSNVRRPRYHVPQYVIESTATPCRFCFIARARAEIPREQFPRSILATSSQTRPTSSRGCHADATRERLPWNSGLSTPPIVCSSFVIRFRSAFRHAATGASDSKNWLVAGVGMRLSCNLLNVYTKHANMAASNKTQSR